MKKIIEIKTCDICGEEVDEFYTSSTHKGRLVAYEIIKEIYYQGKYKMSPDICQKCYDNLQKKLAEILKNVPFIKKIEI